MSTTIELLKEVTTHMRANGVRRVWCKRDSLELEVELDPASQYLGRDTEPASPPDEPEVKKAGQCQSPGCDESGGHLGTALCRKHMLAEMSTGG